MSIIPSGIKSIYTEYADEMINVDMIGQTCTLYFPPKREACSCIPSNFGANSPYNVFRHGGPSPVGVGQNCSLCGGIGYKETEVTTQIRLRIYFSRSDWLKLAPVQIAKADVMTIGFMSDVNSILSCSFLETIDKQSGHIRYRLELSGKPFPHGFYKDRYFMAFWTHK